LPRTGDERALPKVIGADPAAEGSARTLGDGKVMTMTSDRARRLAEAACEAGLVLGLMALPTAWRALDGELIVILAGMLAVLTAATYALHAVTFDCFRLTAQRQKGNFSYTQRKE
jgi:hypothetical protein